VIVERIRMDGRVAVVAGAGGGGIGTEICRAAAEAGASVAGIDNDEAHIGLARAAVEDAGSKFLGIVADVRDQHDVERAFASTVAAFGRVDSVVNVVGGNQPRHWERMVDFPLEAFDEVLDLNLRYAVLTSQAAARRMINAGRGGSVVHVVSVAGLTSSAYNAAYGAGKAALISLTRTMAVEWGRFGIRVNAVAPGTIRTPHDNAGADTSERDQVIALKRRGTAEELASAVLFVLSDLGSFVTGQTIVVDGGSLVRPSYLDHDDLPVFMQNAEIRERLVGHEPGS
jgi:NAD(P)-dependent dehydrogenase (short-subunit alcohol dehydrogenase family)